jgi:predicted RNA-binding protein YlxR (DUF448 family)
MDKLFFSRNNYDLLNQIIYSKIKEAHDVELDQSYNKNILETMKYVYKNVSPQPPPNITPKKYLDMMNIKCLSIAIPNITEIINQRNNPAQKTQYDIHQEQQEKLNQSFMATKQIQEKQSPISQNNTDHLLPQNSNDFIDNNIGENFEQAQNVREQEEQERLASIPVNTFRPQQKEKPASMENVNADYNQKLQDRGLFIPPKAANENETHPQAQMHNQFNQQVTNQMNQEESEPYANNVSPIGAATNSLASVPFNSNESFMDEQQEEEFLQDKRKRLQQFRKKELATIQEEERLPERPVRSIPELPQAYPSIANEPLKTMPIREQERILDDPTFHPNSVENRIPPTIYPEKPVYTKRIQYFTIDSRDRDLELYPNPSFFQVKFAPATNDIVTTTASVNCGTQTIFYTIREDVSGERGASITREYDNIHYLQCTQALVPLEARYVCGICPNRYYDNSIDSVCENTTMMIKDRIIPLEKNSNKAIWNNKIGIQTTVLDVPYLILNIEELESYSPYSGTNTANRNAFAKLVYDTNFGLLSPFIKMSTSEIDEYYLFSPTPLAKLDKMTLFLSTPEGEPFFFGRDKLFIEKFEQSPNFLKNCPSGPLPGGGEAGIYATRIFINTKQSFCNCTIDCNCKTQLKSSCLKPGDLIYFYNTKPCKPNYVSFQDENNVNYNEFRIVVNAEEGENVNISIFIVIDELTGKEEPIDFSKFTSVDNYLAVFLDNRDEFYQILDVDGTNITVKQNGSLQLMTDIIVSKVGFAKQNNKGYQTEHRGEITYKGGVRVCSVGDSKLCPEGDPDCDPNSGTYPDCSEYLPNDAGSSVGFTPIGQEDPTAELYLDIDFPFDNLPQQFLDDHYKDGQVFLIKQKLQISYTFKVVTLEKDYLPIEARIVGP